MDSIGLPDAHLHTRAHLKRQRLRLIDSSGALINPDLPANVVTPSCMGRNNLKRP